MRFMGNLGLRKRFGLGRALGRGRRNFQLKYNKVPRRAMAAQNPKAFENNLLDRGMTEKGHSCPEWGQGRPGGRLLDEGFQCHR